MVKARTPLLSIKQYHAPFSTSVVSMGIAVINCIRCTNYFFQDCSCVDSKAVDKKLIFICFDKQLSDL